MLKDLSLNLKDFELDNGFKMYLAKPNKQIIKNIGISNVLNANLKGIELNGLAELEFEITHEYTKKDYKTGEVFLVRNSDTNDIREEMLIKLSWFNKKRVNWFRVSKIHKSDSNDITTMTVTAEALPSELRKSEITTEMDSVDVNEYFEHVLEQSAWKLGTVSSKLKDTYRSFDENKRSKYEAIMDGAETYGAILDWDEDKRTLNLKSIDEVKVFRGVTLKRENFAESIELETDTDDIVTRLYAYGNEKLGIEKANPTGMAYVEDFSYFMNPFKRDENKNVLSHSYYMSDELCHALLDLEVLQKEYNPKIKQLQELINNAYKDLSTKSMSLVELEGQLISLQALLDTAKATNDEDLIYQRTMEVRDKQSEIDKTKKDIENIQESIDTWELTIKSHQQLISTNSFTKELVDELSLFVYEKEFSDDRYIDDKELYEATLEQFEKYHKPIQTFNVDLMSFVNSIESQEFNNKLHIGEEVVIKSTDFDFSYKSIVLGYDVDLIEGDYNVIISDSLDDVNSLDKLATLIYKADSSSTVLSNNKYKWDSVAEVTNEVKEWRENAINSTNNRIIAGANESMTIDNRGLIARNPDFPNEMLIMQSGVLALSKDGGETWATSVTPDGVVAERIIGKILAGENLLITNEQGSFVIDSKGLTIDMDSINIMSGKDGNRENLIQSWNNLLLTFDEIANDNLVNEYEKNQLDKQWTKMKNIHSSMLETFNSNWKPENVGDPKPKEYEEYVRAYEAVNKYLNTTKQSDGFTLLDKSNRKNTTKIVPEDFVKVFNDYDVAKQKFEPIIPIEFSKSEIRALEEGISLTYTKNDEIVANLNLYEGGVKIDGKLLEINAETEFNKDLTMNAGVIKGKDNGIVIDLNEGTVELNKPIVIGKGSNLVTKDDINKLELEAYSLVLTNDQAMVPTDPNGENGDFTLATTQAVVYKGAKDDTVNWKITSETTTGVTGTLVGNEFKVTKMTRDSGTVILKATQGTTTLTKGFRITKVKAGAHGDSGESAKILSLESEGYVMTFNTDGTPNPTKQSLKVQAQLQNTVGNVSWIINRYSGNTFQSAITKTATENSITINESDFIKDTTSIRILAKLGNLTDTVTIVKVSSGKDGSDGDSIKEVVNYYLSTSQSTGVTTGTSGWTTTIQNMSKDKPYLWNYEVSKSVSGKVISTTTPVIIGYHAKDGQSGKDGVSITSIIEYYQVSNSNTVAPTTWSKTVPQLTEQNKYLWNYEEINYSNQTKDETAKKVIGVYGDTGQAGKDAIVGVLTNESITVSADSNGNVSDLSNANGVFKVFEGIQDKTSSAKFSIVSQNKVVATIDTSGNYKLTAVSTGTTVLSGSAILRAVYGGVTIDKTLSVAKSLAGSSGSSATSYWLTSNANIIKATSTGVHSPDSIKFSSRAKTGSNSPIDYSGRYIIETSEDGNKWTEVYKSTTNETSASYSTKTEDKFVKAKLYQAGSTNILLDEQTIPVLLSSDDVQVGGANLITDTNYIQKPEAWSGSEVEVVKDSPNNYVKVTRKEGVGVVGVISHGSHYFDRDETYTLSFEIKTDDLKNLDYTYIISPQGNIQLTEVSKKNNILADGKWHKYVYTFTTWFEREKCRILIGGRDSSSFDLRRIKLERGNIATDWSPAPQDINDSLQIGGTNLVGEFNKYELSITNSRVTKSSNGYSYVVKLEKDTDYVLHRRNTENNNRFYVCLIDDEVDESDIYNSVAGKEPRVVMNRGNDKVVNFNSESSIWAVIYVTIQRTVDDLSKAFIKLEKGNKPTDWSPAPQDVDNTIENINIGTRNYALKSDKTYTALQNPANISFFGKYVTSIMEPAQEVTVSFDFDYKAYKPREDGQNRLGVEVSIHHTDGTQSWVGSWHYPTKSEDKGRASKTNKIKNTPIDWKKTTDGFGVYFQALFGIATISKIKIEKGNKSSDWTFAPEDIDESIGKVQENVDNMTFGGKNYLKKSDWYVNADSSMEILDSSGKEIKATGSKGKNWARLHSKSVQTMEWIAGEEYTLSFYLKTDRTDFEGISAQIASGDSSNKIAGFGNLEATKEYKFHSFTFKYDGKYDPALTTLQIFIWGTTNQPDDRTIWVKNAKLEKGNKATDWTTAPEDNKVYKAWSNSKDGKKDFTKIYPNRNLFPNTKFLNLDELSTGGMTGKVNGDGSITLTKDKETTSRAFFNNNPVSNIQPKLNTYYSASIDIYIESGFKNIGGSTFFIRSFLPDGKVEDFGYANIASSLPQSRWITLTIENVKMSNESDIFRGLQFCVALANLSIGSIRVRKPKLEESTTNTIFNNNEVEDSIGAHMSYIGYSGYDSDEPSDYTWEENPLAKKTYKAWANREDGLVDFTRVYPKSNLAGIDTIMEHSITSPNTIKIDYNRIEINSNGADYVGFRTFDNDTYMPNEEYTMSFKLRLLDGSISRIGGHTTYIDSNKFKLFIDGIQVSKTGDTWSSGIPFKFAKGRDYDIELQFTTRSSGMTGSSSDGIYIQPNRATFGEKYKVEIDKFKVEEGKRTAFVSSPKDDLINSVMQYVGLSPKDSDNPSDYEWLLSTEFTQAVSQANLDIVEVIANNANNLAENSVQKEEFYSWLEQDYENQVADMKSVSDRNQRDLASLTERTAIVEGNYGDMAVKWNFIDQAITFGNEGMMISNKDSKMAIQISSDKIVFWDNNVDVAFVTGEMLKINRGVFLKSATIGNHIITTYSDKSPVTIIRYVGDVI